MKYLTLLVSFCLISAAAILQAQENHRVPEFELLDRVAGHAVNPAEFKKLLSTYEFSEHPQRERSWGSGFGVFLEQSKEGILSIGIRPPSKMTNMATYSGQLPKRLKPEDTLEAIQQKLGAPVRVIEPKAGYLVVHYDGYNLILLDNKLFEIWLTQFDPKVEDAKELKARQRF